MHVVTNMHVVVFTSVIVYYFRTYYKVVHGGGEEDSGGHTTSLGLCGPPVTSLTNTHWWKQGKRIVSV